MKTKNFECMAALVTGLCAGFAASGQAQVPGGAPFTPFCTLAIGSEFEDGGRARLFRDTAVENGRYFAGSPGQGGGLRVAVGDVNGDGIADVVTGGGPGAGPRVVVFDGGSGDEIQAFLAFDAGFRGGVFVAAGDVDGDGRAEVVAGTDAGGAPQVRVFDGVSGSLLRSFLAYDAAFAGGVRVATGDVNGDGAAEIITGSGPGGGPHVKVFAGADASEIHSFFAFAPAFSGGVFVGAGAFDGEVGDDLVVGADAESAPGAGPHVKVFSGSDYSEAGSFFAFPGFAGGAAVSKIDLDGDRRDEVAVVRRGGLPLVRIFSPDGTPRKTWSPDVTGSRGAGLFVAGANSAGQAIPSIVFGNAGNGAPVATRFALVQESRAFLPFAPSDPSGAAIALADHTGDGVPDIIAGAGPGITPQVRVIDGATGFPFGGFLAYEPAFRGGLFVASGDFDGDGRAEIVTGPGAGGGPHVRVFDGQTAGEVHAFFAYETAFTGGVRVATGDVNGDGVPDIVTGTGPGARAEVKVFDGRRFGPIGGFFAFEADFTGGIHVATGDVNGDGFEDIITGAGAGGGPHIRVFSGKDQSPLADFPAFDRGFKGGVYVAAGDVTGDGRADIVTAPGEGGNGEIRVFSGDGSVRLETLSVPGAQGFPVAVARSPVRVIRLIGYELRPGGAELSFSGARGTFLHLETSPDGVHWRGVGSAYSMGETVELTDPGAGSASQWFARGRSR